MTRRGKTILDDLALLPWWLNVILAALVCISFKYFIPSVSVKNPLYKGIAKSLPGYALIVGVIILFVAGLFAFNAWRKGQLLEHQTGIRPLTAAYFWNRLPILKIFYFLRIKLIKEGIS